MANFPSHSLDHVSQTPREYYRATVRNSDWYFGKLRFLTPAVSKECHPVCSNVIDSLSRNVALLPFDSDGESAQAEGTKGTATDGVLILACELVGLDTVQKFGDIKAEQIGGSCETVGARRFGLPTALEACFQAC